MMISESPAPSAITTRRSNPPYAPRNGPLGSIEELLLVRGVTPALLFGADLNRNGVDRRQRAKPREHRQRR